MTDAERALLITVARALEDLLDLPPSRRIEIRDLLRVIKSEVTAPAG